MQPSSCCRIGCSGIDVHSHRPEEGCIDPGHRTAGRTLGKVSVWGADDLDVIFNIHVFSVLASLVLCAFTAVVVPLVITVKN